MRSPDICRFDCIIHLRGEGNKRRESPPPRRASSCTRLSKTGTAVTKSVPTKTCQTSFKDYLPLILYFHLSPHWNSSLQSPCTLSQWIRLYTVFFFSSSCRVRRVFFTLIRRRERQRRDFAEIGPQKRAKERWRTRTSSGRGREISRNNVVSLISAK